MSAPRIRVSQHEHGDRGGYGECVIIEVDGPSTPKGSDDCSSVKVQGPDRLALADLIVRALRDRRSEEVTR